MIGWSGYIVIPILTDSDILIEVFRKRDQKIQREWTSLIDSEQPLLISPVSIAELWAGVRPSEVNIVNALLDSLTCVSIDKAAGRLAGDFLQQYSRSHGLATGDALIAACTMTNHAVLWTRNRKHYPMPEITFWQ